MTSHGYAQVDGLFVGLLSGTSIDAIDAALFRIEGHSIRMLSALAVPIAPSIKSALLYLTECDTVSVGDADSQCTGSAAHPTARGGRTQRRAAPRLPASRRRLSVP